jgi:hypothetical protein
LPLNWLYSPGQKNGLLPYAQIFFSVNSGNAVSLAPGSPLNKTKDVVAFHGSTNATLVLQFTPPSCLHVLNPIYDSDLPLAPASDDIYKSLLNSGFPMLGRKDALALPLSNMSLIAASGGIPRALPALFGAEPVHTWCYYYEKADLARQTGDWSAIAQLGDEAFKESYRPDDPSEYLPFIEAEARLKRWDDAKQLTLAGAASMPSLAPALCALWQRVDVAPEVSSQEHDLIRNVEDRLQYCPIH